MPVVRVLLALGCACAGTLAFSPGFHGASVVRAHARRFVVSMKEENSKATTEEVAEKRVGRVVKPKGNAESNVVPFGTGTTSREVESPVQRRTLVVAGVAALLGLAAVSGAGADNVDAPASAAVERMRARRKAAVPDEEVEPAVGSEEPDMMDRIVSGTKSTIETAKVVGGKAATVAGGVYKAGQAAVTGVDAALDVAIPVAKNVAEKATPVIKEGIERATPMMMDAADRARPLVQQAIDKADPAMDRLIDSTSEVMGPALRGTTEAVERVTKNPEINAAISQTQGQIQDASKAIEPFVRETSRTIKPAIPVVGKVVASLAGVLASTARWCAEFVGIVSQDGLDGARDEVLSTLKEGAQAGYQVSKDVVLPKAVEVTQQVVIPAAQEAGRGAAKGLGEAAQKALETPSGQALSQKVTNAVTDLSSQKDALAQNTGQTLKTAVQELGKIKMPQIQIEAPKQ